jgi:ADP-heptose:LPS heptosyltransferase
MKPIKHLLVIRLSAMGDVAMTVPVLKAFCDRYPQIHVTVLTKGFFAPLFSQLPNVTVHIAEVDGKHKGVFGLRKLYNELKTKRIDGVADLHNVLRSTILKLFFKSGGFQFEQIDKGRNDKKALISGNKNSIRPLKTTHERYCEVFAQLGFQLNLTKTSVLERIPLQEDLLQLLGSEKRKYIGIAPFAAFRGKMYPLHLMEKVVFELNVTDNYKIFLFGGGETELKQLSLWEKKFENTVSVSAKLTFEKELQLISNLDLMLAMDSGNGHLAAMYGVPTITLWGVTHPYAGFAPFGQPEQNFILADRTEFPLIPTSIYGNKMPEGYEKAMETIPAEEILKKIKTIID